MAQIRKALSIFGTISRVCSWYLPALPKKQDNQTKPSNAPKPKGAQIDLLIDREDGVIDLCEMKYTKQPYEVTYDDEQKVQNRRDRLKAETGTDKSIHLILVSASGVKPNGYSDEFQDIITADALFKE